MEQLFNQLLRPKLRTFISDIYKDTSYVLDDDAYTAAELRREPVAYRVLRYRSCGWHLSSLEADFSRLG